MSSSQRSLSESSTEGDELPAMKRRFPSFYGEDDSDHLEENGVQPKKKMSYSKSESNLEMSLPPHESSLDRPGEYSSVAKNMMSKMGHKVGMGLGKSGQGRLEPVGLSTQRGRSGLGHVVPLLDLKDVTWDINEEHYSVNEAPIWIPDSDFILPEPSSETWILEGPRKETINDETDFVDPVVLQNVMKSKSIFDSMGEDEMRKARTRSNPFETIRKAIFMNRAAVKMANIDAVFDFMFTSPRSQDGSPLLGPNELLYFADVCAGPGGFSEYVLWRKKWRAKGFGFTLKATNDFKTEDFIQGPPESFEKHYGAEGDGDVFKESNIVEFSKFVLESTDGKGVHFMMADGGFSVKGQENIQEILSKQLYLCQFLVALNIVSVGGHFICKLFDLFTPYSVGLVYLMYKAFDKVSLHKPNTSRPANSERYLVCKWKRENIEPIRDYMFHINRILNSKEFSLFGSTKSKLDINEVVPREFLQREKHFVQYVIDSNTLFGEWQVVALKKIAAFAKDRGLIEWRQKDTKNSSLLLWNIPTDLRCAPVLESPKNAVSQMVKDFSVLCDKHILMEKEESLSQHIKSIYDWKGMLLGEADERTFFYGQGRSNIFFWTSKGNWKKVDQQNIRIELPSRTLVYAEIVKEYRGADKSQKKVFSFHIIDALFLGGEDVRHLSIKERVAIIQTFVKALNKKTQPMNTIMRFKQIFGLENLQDQLDALSLKTIKGCRPYPRLTISSNGDASSDPFFIPHGVLLFKLVTENFTIRKSKSSNCKYWSDITKKKSVYGCPPGATAGFTESFSKRIFWPWGSDIQILPDQPVNATEGKIHFFTMLKHIQNNQ